MTRRILSVLLLVPTTVVAQKSASISGVVRDAEKTPLANAEVVLRPSGRRARTDSAGRYSIASLDDGAYVIVARKLGFQPDQGDLKLTKHSALTMDFALEPRPLDTVLVTERGRCLGFELRGFECRKQVGGGQFLDFPDIDEKEEIFTIDLFRKIPGFRVNLRTVENRVVPTVVSAKGYGCITYYVDGRVASRANPVPQRTKDLVAMEIYAKSDSVPVANARDLWKGRDASMDGRCQVVVVWTVWAKA